MEPHYIEELNEDAAKATALVQSLTSTKGEMHKSLPKGTEQLPGAELHVCKGLLFSFVTKVGAGLSASFGRGFVISKVRSESHDSSAGYSWTWSPPLFVQVTAASIGISLGYANFETITILDTEDALQSFAKPVSLELNTDVGAAAGSEVGLHLPVTAVGPETFSYSITKGGMVDVSITGLKYAIDTKKCSACYGSTTTPDGILASHVSAPPQFQELYQALDHALKTYYESLARIHNHS